MRNLESFPENELLWLMNLFAHADGHSICRPYAARVEDRNRTYLNSVDRRQDEVAKRQIEHCWFDDPLAFQQAQDKYGRLFRYTYWALNLTVARGDAVGKKKNMLTVVADSVWMDQDFMLRRLINVVFTVDSTADIRAWIAIQDAIEKQTIALPSLERLAVQVFCSSSNGDTSEEMTRFLAFSLEDLAKARGIMVEVHCLVGSMLPVKTWAG